MLAPQNRGDVDWTRELTKRDIFSRVVFGPRRAVLLETYGVDSLECFQLGPDADLVNVF